MPNLQQNHLLNDELVAEAVSCERGGRILFENVSFSLRPGQAMIIEGENGTGKTSLLRIITGLSPPSTGYIRWGQQPIDSVSDVFQRQLLYIGHLAAVKRELTVRENLHLLKRFWPQDVHLAVSELAENVGLRQRLSVPCAKLSAGQLRRVALARLFVSRQSLWVLDEPLTALDVNFIDVVEKCLQNHLSKGGMAILTTHRGIDLGAQSSFHLAL